VRECLKISSKSRNNILLRKIYWFDNCLSTRFKYFRFVWANRQLQISFYYMPFSRIPDRSKLTHLSCPRLRDAVDSLPLSRVLAISIQRSSSLAAEGKIMRLRIGSRKQSSWFSVSHVSLPGMNDCASRSRELLWRGGILKSFSDAAFQFFKGCTTLRKRSSHRRRARLVTVALTRCTFVLQSTSMTLVLCAMLFQRKF
jgi:hypothetical protein